MLITSKTRTNYYGANDTIAARVRPGEIFTLECTSFTEGFTLADIGQLKIELAVVPVTGPLWVEGSRPGDTLRVDILKLEIMRDFGCVILIPGRGAFGDEVTKFAVRGVPIDDSVAHFSEAIALPLRPMLGKIGVAPDGEPILSNRPGPHGGNMDNVHIREGSSVYLPVFVEGAYFSAGDAHAVQGDGESGISAVECEMRATLRIELLRQLPLSRPVVATGSLTMTVAEASTLDEAARIALHDMADLLRRRHPLTLEEAAMLLSIAADVHVCQLVNPLVGVKVMMPSWLVGFPGDAA